MPLYFGDVPDQSPGGEPAAGRGFQGTVYLLSPLHLAAHEADQLLFFHSRGLRVNLGNMITMGGSGPVTLAGALVWRWPNGSPSASFITFFMGIGPGAWAAERPHGHAQYDPALRPAELLLSNLATMQLARHYGVSGHAHGGLSDAKPPLL